MYFYTTEDVIFLQGGQSHIGWDNRSFCAYVTVPLNLAFTLSRFVFYYIIILSIPHPHQTCVSMHVGLAFGY